MAKRILKTTIPRRPPPKILKAFHSLNTHLADMTEQYGQDGQMDYDNIAFRGYSLKDSDDGDGGVTLTGIRTLSNGLTLVINSPYCSLDNTESDYPHLANLISSLETCDRCVKEFIKNNPSPSDIQGKLFDAKPENIILSADKDITAVDILFEKEIEEMAANTKRLNELQAKMDASDPVRLEDMTLEYLTEKAKKTDLTPEERGRMQQLNAAEKKLGKSEQQKKDRGL